MAVAPLLTEGRGAGQQDVQDDPQGPTVHLWEDRYLLKKKQSNKRVPTDIYQIFMIILHNLGKKLSISECTGIANVSPRGQKRLRIFFSRDD